jgi:hypothetical protein
MYLINAISDDIIEIKNVIWEGISLGHQCQLLQEAGSKKASFKII